MNEIEKIRGKHKLKNPVQIYYDDQVVRILLAEIDRLTEENRRLKEVLTAMARNTVPI